MQPYDLGALQASLPGSDATPAEPPLLRLASESDAFSCVVAAAGARSLAKLAMCSLSLHQHCMGNTLWAGLLAARWDDARIMCMEINHVNHRTYATRHVQENLDRWSRAAATPKTVGSRRRRASAQPSPAGSIRSPLGLLSHSLSNQAAPHSPELISKTANVCVASRLQQGLRSLIESGPERVRAFPQDENMDVWSATVECPPSGPYAGKKFSLQLVYDLSRGLEGGAWLPTVQLLYPTCFHPNVGTDGMLCRRALHDRCTPLEAVGDILHHVMELIGRPSFSVRPRNADAAACWFDDNCNLRERIRKAMLGQPPTPRRTVV